MSEVSLKVNIAGSEFNLRLNQADETNVLEAAKLINDKITELEKAYSVKEKKDILAMALLQIVSDFLSLGRQNEAEITRLKGLLDELDEMVKRHNSNA